MAAKRRRRRQQQQDQPTPARIDVPAPALSRFGSDTWIVLALFAGSFLLYLPTLDHPFVDYDDPQYIDPPMVQRGLTPGGVRWAFTTTAFANWLPVTWLSHMLDVSLYGRRAGGHHATSALLHALNAALVFLFFRSATGSRGRWPAGVAAALFAVHPLRVESVAWIAERKDVLAATFGLLALLAYVRYARQPGVWRYALVAVLFSLGLMSKTMLVTLPFVLLLVDIWPLGRWRALPPARDDYTPPAKAAGWLVLEKLPLLGLSAISSAWTIVLQREGGATWGGQQLNLTERLGNAVVSVARYVGKLIRPVDLSVFYPHPGSWAGWQVAAAFASIVALTAVALLLVRRRPYVAVGWFWFLGMLVPVSGIVQVGLQAMADRYTYLPSIGLMAALTYGAADLVRHRPQLLRPLRLATAAALALLAVCTWLQESYWKSTLDLFEHALVVDPDNWAAHVMVGHVRSANGDDAAALQHYGRAITLNPRHPNAYVNRGYSLTRLGRTEEAIADYRQAIAIAPELPTPHLNLGKALRSLKRHRDASAAFAEAARLAPGNADAWYQWGKSLQEEGNRNAAASRFAEALRIDPMHTAARRPRR